MQHACTQVSKLLYYPKYVPSLLGYVIRNREQWNGADFNCCGVSLDSRRERERRVTGYDMILYSVSERARSLLVVPSEYSSKTSATTAWRNCLLEVPLGCLACDSEMTAAVEKNAGRKCSVDGVDGDYNNVRVCGGFIMKIVIAMMGNSYMPLGAYLLQRYPLVRPCHSDSFLVLVVAVSPLIFSSDSQIPKSTNPLID